MSWMKDGNAVQKEKRDHLVLHDQEESICDVMGLLELSAKAADTNRHESLKLKENVQAMIKMRALLKASLTAFKQEVESLTDLPLERRSACRGKTRLPWSDESQEH